MFVNVNKALLKIMFSVVRFETICAHYNQHSGRYTAWGSLGHCTNPNIPHMQIAKTFDLYWIFHIFNMI